MWQIMPSFKNFSLKVITFHSLSISLGKESYRIANNLQVVGEVSYPMSQKKRGEYLSLTLMTAAFTLKEQRRT